jgi:hypothetical protein
MLKKTGVWIDTKKAVLVFIEKKITVSTLYSLIEARERIPGEVKWYTRFGNSFLPMQVEVAVVIG